MTQLETPVQQVTVTAVEPWPAYLEPYRPEVQDLDRNAVLAFVEGQKGQWMNVTLRLAAGCRRAEELGVAPELLYRGRLACLRKVAFGQLVPELFERYGHRKGLMARLAAMPLPEQRRLAEAGRVKVAEFAADGGITHRVLPLEELDERQIRLVFDEDHVRSEAAQAIRLQRAAPPPRADVQKFALCHRPRGIRVNNVFISEKELRDVVAQLSRQP